MKFALKDGCNKHDKRYVEGEAITCLRSMYGDDLVGI